MEKEWIKLYVKMFEHEKMKIINSMPDNNLITYIWIRLLIHAGRTNDDGKIYVSKSVPYNIKTLSIIFERSKSEIKSALDILRELSMITIDEDNIIKIKNWCRYQDPKAVDKKREQSKVRMRNKRERDKDKNDDECYADVTLEENDVLQNVTLSNKRKNKEKEEEEDINKKERRKKKVVSLKGKKDEEVNQEAIKILKHYETIIGKTGVFKFESIALAVSKHGVDRVKQAFDRAIAAGKINMMYVNGILRNWAREGYPKEGEVEDGNRGADADGGKFKDIKPPEPKVYTEGGEEMLKDLV